MKRTLIPYALALLATSCIKTYIPIPPPSTSQVDSTTYVNDTAYIVSTLAGSGSPGFKNGTGTAASFNVPSYLAVDANGNIYVDDYGNNAIRKVTPAGTVTTFAGSGAYGNTDAQGTAASFSGPYAVTCDSANNIYVPEWNNDDIRKITPTGIVSTLAGSPYPGYTDATGVAAQFHDPAAIACDSHGNLYVFDSYNNRVRKITSAGVVTTFVGSGIPGSTDGTGATAQLGGVYGMCTDAGDNVYMADELYNTIRKITPAGVVTTIAGVADTDHFIDLDGVGTKAKFAGPNGIAADKYGNLYVTDAAVGGATIRKITPSGVVTTIAGIPGVQGSADGPGNQATFNSPSGIAVGPNGVIYVSDALSATIRVLTPKH